MSTSIVKEYIGTFAGCDPTFRLDCNLIDLVLSSCKPLIYPVRLIERFVSSVMLELVIQGFLVMTTYHVSECSNTFSSLKTKLSKSVDMHSFRADLKFLNTTQNDYRKTQDHPSFVCCSSRHSGKLFRKSASIILFCKFQLS